MHAAFYRGTRPGLQGIYSRAVRVIDRGPYSHCELVFSDGMSGSASYIDGGVRLKAIDYNPAHWDFVALPDAAEPYARDWFERNAGAPYDLMGNVRFVLPIVPASASGWFCSEAMAAALKLKEPWRFGPNGLAALLPRLFC
ncbi:MAG: hypothetical protein ACRCTO_23845 [Pseudomonas paracarnis]